MVVCGGRVGIDIVSLLQGVCDACEWARGCRDTRCVSSVCRQCVPPDGTYSHDRIRTQVVSCECHLSLSSSQNGASATKALCDGGLRLGVDTFNPQCRPPTPLKNSCTNTCACVQCERHDVHVLGRTQSATPLTRRSLMSSKVDMSTQQNEAVRRPTDSRPIFPQLRCCKVSKVEKVLTTPGR